MGTENGDLYDGVDRDGVILDRVAYLGDMRKDPPFLRSAYNYDTDAVSERTGLECQDESLTLQSQADEADINVLVRRFGITGQMPQGVVLPTYQDFEGIWDYRSALDAVKNAEAAFMEIPAEIRSKFDNDPGKFVEFCSAPENIDKLREMGLADAVPSTGVNNGGKSESAGESAGNGDKAGS